jgi:hypothetical protein
MSYYIKKIMSKYYGVIGNRDYIKYRGEKRPYWEFLDFQPDGYLSSIVYARKDCPDLPMIWDCGAWSYKNERTPVYRKYVLTPGYALYECYMNLAKPDDILIAPDHMLIDGVNLENRRKINQQYAMDFLTLCKKEPYTPMAVCHGMDLDERIESIKYLVDLGYKHIAIGGVAARAAQKRIVSEMIAEIRKAFPDIWIHILGLSSPDYTKMWNNLGIDSFDGSSHFKQAFTGGAFFTIEGGKLKKWQAARPGEKITAPECSCLACEKMREENIDTRSYGSNETNMGRAAHNQNMLMYAQKIALNGTTVLVSCVGKKASNKTPAKELYQSDWFKKARKYAEQNGDRWFVLSALHGLVDPEKPIRPYEKTLNKMSAHERGKWCQMVWDQIRTRLPKGRIVFLAGEKYRNPLSVMLEGSGYFVEVPMKGMGIGQQLSWLKSQIKQEQLCFP